MWEQVPVSWGQDTYRAAMPEGVRELVRMVDYNDVGKLEAAMGEEGEQMAAILLEPVTGTGVFTGRRADRVGWQARRRGSSVARPFVRGNHAGLVRPDSGRSSI